MASNSNYKLGLHVALCIIFLTFTFIDGGMIGRLRHFNYVVFVVFVVLTIREFICARGNGK